MKNLRFLIIFLVIGNQCISQIAPKKSLKHNYYVGAMIYGTNGAGLSNVISPSIEAGVCIKNFAFALDAGRSNINYKSKDVDSNYFWKFKFMPIATLDFLPTNNFVLKGYLIFGIGNYFHTKNYFIEYGTGFSVDLNKNSDVFIQFSSCNNINYLGFGIIRSIFQKK